jgi:FMNH2-dependent dimethyl sulfone monooxygenase
MNVPTPRISTAPNLAAIDGLTSFERALRQPLMVGLFLPHQQGAWSPSKAPRGTDWSFAYNAECAIQAEEMGFDLVFGLAQWLGKGGYGGDIKFRENSLDPLIATAGLAPLTHNILLISTVHILYGWHPLHIAKYGAVIDHIARGRWGINVVTGYKDKEPRMFGLPKIERDERYARAAEFTELLKKLWTSDEDLDFEGQWWSTEKAFVAPKPVNGLPVLVNAASSGAGLDYATSHSDLIFSTSPTGADPEKACESLPNHIARIKKSALAKGRDIRVMINPHVICRPTDKEAWEWRDRILSEQDEQAVGNFVADFMGGDQSSWKGHSPENWAIGGNVHLVGSPERIVEWMVRLKAAGVDGVQINFYDFLPDLAYFREAVWPLMHAAGLRAPVAGSWARA